MVKSSNHWQNLKRIGNLPNASLAAYALRDDAPFVLLARDEKDRLELLEFLRFFAPEREILELPAWDCRPYDRISPRPDISAERASTLMRLAQGETGILLTTQNAAMQKLPPKAVMAQNGLSLQLGHEIDFDALHAFAGAAGYQIVPTVRGAGEYAVRGGIVDIFPAGFDAPVRIDLFGDVIDRLRYFDPESQRSGEALDSLRIAPSDELIYTDESIGRFRDGYRALHGVPAKDDPFYESVTARIRPQGIEHYLPLFYEELASLGDYLSDDWRIFAREEILERVDQRFEGIAEHQSGKGNKQIHLVPDALYLDAESFATQFAGKNSALAYYGAIPTGANAIDAGFAPARDFAPERADQTGKLYQALTKYVQNEAKQRPVLLACASEGSRARMKNLLNEYEVQNLRLVEDAKALGQGVSLCVLPLRHGFTSPDLLLLSEADILG